MAHLAGLFRAATPIAKVVRLGHDSLIRLLPIRSTKLQPHSELIDR